MPDQMIFNEGATYLANNGLPATVYFLLSSKSVGATSPFAVGDTLAGGQSGEITGTGYARASEAEPTAVNGVVSFVQKSWATGSATNWSATTRSVVAVTTSDGTGVMLFARNLQTGGIARDLSQANTTENVTPTFTLPAGAT